LPRLQVGQQILDKSSICLVFDRRFKSPLVLAASYFNLLVAILMTMPSILLLSKLTTFWACRLASSVLGRFISKNLK